MHRSKKVASVFLVLAVLLTAQLASTDGKERARSFQEFSKRVNVYVSLHKTVEGTLPPLKTTDVPELIAAHQQALARKIREARPQARLGDIFAEDARGAFRHTIREATDGSHGPTARAAIKKEEPLPRLKLRVNDVYPDKLPVTRVPATMLLLLPKLPDEVEYRIFGRNLLLLDVRANMIVDWIPEAMPRYFVPNP